MRGVAFPEKMGRSPQTIPWLCDCDSDPSLATDGHLEGHQVPPLSPPHHVAPAPANGDNEHSGGGGCLSIVLVLFLPFFTLKISL